MSGAISQNLVSKNSGSTISLDSKTTLAPTSSFVDIFKLFEALDLTEDIDSQLGHGRDPGFDQNVDNSNLFVIEDSWNSPEQANLMMKIGEDTGLLLQQKISLHELALHRPIKNEPTLENSAEPKNDLPSQISALVASFVDLAKQMKSEGNSGIDVDDREAIDQILYEIEIDEIVEPTDRAVGSDGANITLHPAMNLKGIDDSGTFEVGRQQALKLFTSSQEMYKSNKIGFLNVDLTNPPKPQVFFAIMDGSTQQQNILSENVNVTFDDVRNEVNIDLKSDTPGIIIVGAHRVTSSEDYVGDLQINLSFPKPLGAEFNGITPGVYDAYEHKTLQSETENNLPETENLDVVFEKIPRSAKVENSFKIINEAADVSNLFRELSIISELKLARINTVNLLNSITKEIELGQGKIDLGTLISKDVSITISSGLGADRLKSLKSSYYTSTASIIGLRADNSLDNFSFRQSFLNYLRGNFEQSQPELSEGEFDQGISWPTRNMDRVAMDVDQERLSPTRFISYVSDKHLQVVNSSVNTTAMSQQLSVMDSQFVERLTSVIMEQALANEDLVEFNLEPKSFGKIKVSAQLENNGIDVKLSAENSAAITILRASESLLNSIAEQHGLRLANYSVDSGGGNSADSGGNQSNQNNENRRDETTQDDRLSDQRATKRLVDENRLLNLIA